MRSLGIRSDTERYGSYDLKRKDIAGQRRMWNAALTFGQIICQGGDPAVDTSSPLQGDDVLSRQRLRYLHAELRRIESYVNGVNSRLGRDPGAVLSTVAGELTELRRLAARYAGTTYRDG
jgi:hypothetical protein